MFRCKQHKSKKLYSPVIKVQQSVTVLEGLKMNQQEDFARRRGNRNKTAQEQLHKAAARDLVQVALQHRKPAKE